MGWPFQQTPTKFKDSFRRPGEPKLWPSLPQRLGFTYLKWDITGRAAYDWDEMRKCIKDYLDAHSDKFPNPGSIFPPSQLRGFMVGHNEEHARPFVVVIGDERDREHLKAVRDTIVTSHLLRDGWDCTVLFETIEQPGPRNSSDSDEGGPSNNESVAHDSHVSLRRREYGGVLIEWTGNNTTQRLATIGGYVRIGRSPLGLTVGHIFYPPLQQAPNHAKPYFHRTEDDIGEYADLRSVNLKYISGNAGPWPKLKLDDMELDWALTNSEEPIAIEWRKHGPLETLKVRAATPTLDEDIPVFFQTDLGCWAKSKGFTVLLDIPHAKQMQEVLVIDLHDMNAIQPGDCGVWARDMTNGELLGMLIATCPGLREVYILPIHSLLGPIQKAISSQRAAATGGAESLGGGEIIEFSGTGMTSLFTAALEIGNKPVLDGFLQTDIPNRPVDTDEGTEWLAIAERKGFNDIFNKMLENLWANPDYESFGYESPLSSAAKKGHAGIVMKLLASKKLKSVPAYRTSYRPLAYAIQKGHYDIVMMLLQYFKPNRSDFQGRTPLFYAVEGEDTAVIEYLLDQDATDVNFRDKTGRTPIFHALKCEDRHVFRMLSECRDIQIPASVDGRTLLMDAVFYNHTTAVRWLLKRNEIPLKAKDENGDNVFHYVSASASKEILRLLLKVDPTGVDLRNRQGRTPLSIAAAEGHANIVKDLLALDRIRPNVKDNGRRTPLSWAIEKGHAEVVQLLLETKPVDYIPANPRDRRLWSHAVKRGHTDTLDVLVQYLDRTQQNPKPCFEDAIQAGEHDIVKRLMSVTGYYPNSKFKHGKSLLHLAVQGKRTRVVEELMAVPDRVEVNARDASERTALIYAVQEEFVDTSEVLLKSGRTDPNLGDPDGKTPLMYAAERGCLNIMRLLLRSDQIEPDQRDNAGRTALMYAACAGWKNVAGALLDTGKVDINAQDSEGRNARMLAEMNNRQPMISFLDNQSGRIASSAQSIFK